MTNLQHFLTRKILQNLPAAFLNNKTSPWPNFNISIQQDYYMNNLQHFLKKLLHDQPSTFLNNKTTTDLPAAFLNTKLLHDQPSTFLNNKTTTWPTFNISLQQDYYMTNLQLLKNKTTTFFNISLQQDYYMTNLQHFLQNNKFWTTKLLHDQLQHFLTTNKTTWPTFNIS